MYTLKLDRKDNLSFTSDNQFDHYNIARYCNRPFEDRKAMNGGLIDNWNAVVPKNGIVIHCGDFMLPHKEGIKYYWKYIKQLNGTIYLTRGNHDRILLGVYDINGNRFDISDITVKDVKLVVIDMMMIKIGVDIEIFAQHYPCTTFNGVQQVFGHIHTHNDGLCHNMADDDVRPWIKTNQYDVSVDQNNYYPISYDELEKKFNLLKQQELYVNCEVANLLIKNGFNYRILAYYCNDNKEIKFLNEITKKDIIIAPVIFIQNVLNWLKEKFKIIIYITKEDNQGYYNYHIIQDNILINESCILYNTKTHCLNNAIKNALLIKKFE